MKTLKHAIALALMGLLFVLSPAYADQAQAATAGGHHADLASNYPLAIFFIVFTFVYLCNRPRPKMIYARARNRIDR